MRRAETNDCGCSPRGLLDAPISSIRDLNCNRRSALAIDVKRSREIRHYFTSGCRDPLAERDRARSATAYDTLVLVRALATLQGDPMRSRAARWTFVTIAWIALVAAGVFLF